MAEWWNSLPPAAQTWLLGFLKGTLVLLYALLNFAIAMVMERKVAGWMQNRVGPWRSGFHGWLQAIPDLLKLWVKEFIEPKNVDRPLYLLAPFIGFMASIVIWLIIPFGPNLVAMDLDIGIIFIAAVTGFDVIALFMAGWGSNNKYSLISAMRGAAQMISYEVTLILSIIGVVMMAGTLQLSEIVEMQINRGAFGWYLFPQLLGFIIYVIASLAELKRAPFDLTEAEHEIIAGYTTEYSSMRWALFMLAEYIHLVAWSAIAATLFLGGWSGPTIPDLLAGLGNLLNVVGIGGPLLQAAEATAFLGVGAWAWVAGIFWLTFKTYLFVFLAMWIRWTLPRVRIDQLMDLGWKFLLPVSLFHIFLTGVLRYAAVHYDGLPLTIGSWTIRLLGLWAN